MLERLTGRVSVYTGGVNVGLIETGEDSVILVDTGANESNARKVLRIVREELRREVVAVLSTHAHADHVGGHAFVVKRTDAAVFAPSIEASVIRNPIFQPVLLYGGAAPPKALRQRFILADPSPVDAEIDSGPVDVSGVTIQAVSLKGHAPNQMGFAIDGVIFCADVVFPRSAIEKFRIPYLFDLGDHLASLETVARFEATTFVPGHGAIEDSIWPLVAENRAVIDETIDCIRTELASPRTLEEVAERVFESMRVPMTSHISYYLLRPTIGAYLTYLEARGDVEHFMDAHVAKWRLIR